MIRDVDRGYRAMIDRVFELGKPKVAVGIFEADGQAPAGEGITLIEVAVINEFGGGDVPARSFLRGWFDEHRERAQKALVVLCQGVLRGEYTAKVAIERFGLWLQAEVQKRIAQGIPPANAPSTVAKKGSSKPLINTGQLRSSITFAVDWGSGTLKVHKSGATKKREADAKAEARAHRRAEKRKEFLRRKARKNAARQFKLKARKTFSKARKNVRQVVKSTLRDARKGGGLFLRKAKAVARTARKKTRKVN